MLGDNIEADVLGAEAVGIPAILVLGSLTSSIASFDEQRVNAGTGNCSLL
ncbi:MAG: HAD hydrolase-like protein [Ktedonobacteraceae bacterium]|nr:HAD hydrolase-like protein [Ktedonobacteraceae bacterium]